MLVAAASVRLVVLAAASTDDALFVGGDTNQYLALADHPDGYWDPSSPSWELSFTRPPGYPLLLAPVRALSSSLLAAGLLQVAVGTLAAWLTYRAGRRLIGPGAALAAGMWVALDPATVVQSSRLLTEVPFSVAFAMWVLCTVRALRHESAVWAAGAGLALAASAFLRPISLYLPLLLGPALFVAARRRTAPRSGARPLVVTMAFACAFSLPAGAWVVRNEVAGGITAFSAIEGVNLLDYRAAASMAEEDGTTVEAARREARAILAERIEQGPDGLEGPVLDHRMAEVGRELILEHPVGYVRQATKGLARTLFGTQRTETSELAGTVPGGVVVELAVTAAASASALLLAVGSAAGAVVAVRRRHGTILVTLVLPLAYLLVVGSGLESDARFRVPLVPAMALLSAHALSVWTSFRRRNVDDTVIDLREPVTGRRRPSSTSGSPSTTGASHRARRPTDPERSPSVR